MTFKLSSPNPDMNGVKIEGYDRVQREADGYFHVADSNHADKLKGAPWFFTEVAEPRKAVFAPAAKPVEEKAIEEMDRNELAIWLNDRGITPAADDSDEVLLAVAQAKQKEEAKASNKEPAPATSSKKK